MYEGDVDRLRRIFNLQCRPFGENRSRNHEFPLEGFLDQIGSEPVPKEQGEPFEMRLVSVDRTASIAIAKVDVRYQNRRFTNYLMLQRTGDGWNIARRTGQGAQATISRTLGSRRQITKHYFSLRRFQRVEYPSIQRPYRMGTGINDVTMGLLEDHSQLLPVTFNKMTLSGMGDPILVN